MKRVKISRYIFFFLFFFIFTIPCAFSSWIISKDDIGNIVNVANLDPVCYINSNNSANQYYSIERALMNASSGDTVYVIPETNPTIKYNCSIKNGVTLAIGSLTKNNSYILDSNGNYTYIDRGIFDENNDTSNENLPASRGPHVQSYNFADSTEANVNLYRKNLIHLKATLKIEANARLNIGGRLGSESQALAGCTTGDYAEILMYEGSTIDNYGTIDCPGYIKKVDSSTICNVFNRNGSKVYTPFVLGDFNGGTYSATCNQKDSEKVMPFNQWVLPNLQVSTTYYFGSSLFGYYDAYNNTYMSKTVLFITVTVKKGHKSGTVSVIGTTNSIFNINEGGSIIIKPSSAFSKYTIYGSGYLINKNFDIDIYGGAEIEKMLIPNPMPDLEKYSGITNVDIKDVDSSQYFFSLPHYYDFHIYGNLNIKTKQKVMPGCNMYVEENGELNINNQLIVYENFDESSSSKAVKYPLKFNQNKVSYITNCIFNSGTINCNSAFGGKIYPLKSNSILNLSSSTSLSVTSREMSSGAMDIPNFNATYQPDVVQSARGPISSYDNVSNFGTNVYVSEIDENGNYYWKLATDLDSYTITYHLNGGTSSVNDGETKTYYLPKGSTNTLTTAPVQNPTKQYYTFAGWYLDEALTQSLDNGYVASNGSVINLYAKYSDKQYQIDYIISNSTGLEIEYTNNNPTIITKTLFDNNGGKIQLNNATSNMPDLVEFDGWYTGDSFELSTKINSINSLQNYSLYGRFVKIKPKIHIDGLLADGSRITYSLDENGKMNDEVKNDISDKMNLIRNDSDTSYYISTFSFDGNNYDLNSLSNLTFTNNAVITCNKNNKLKLTYTNISSNDIIKYYVKNDDGTISGQPVIEEHINNSSYFDTNDRKFASWVDGSGNVISNDISSITNYCKGQNSSCSLRAKWKYKLVINIKSFKNCDYAIVNGTKYSSTGNYTDYILEGVKFACTLDATNDPRSRNQTVMEFGVSLQNLSVIITNYQKSLRPTEENGNATMGSCVCYIVVRQNS